MGARHKVLPPLPCKHAAEERLSARAESMIPACLRRFASCGLRPSFAFPRDEVPLHAHEWGRVIKSFLRFRASTPRRRDFRRWNHYTKIVLVSKWGSYVFFFLS
ncbi:hypothetical protein GCWU000341_01903 [Oribacterium sp. oral taxon 078 str. F0262]|nr:hypothetical protein GCWU000341_01903 [Oribacterium sp. oral taxon 078 str. F0262]